MNSSVRFTLIGASFIAIVDLALLSCDKSNLPPVAACCVYPSTGDTSLVFEFNASNSTDDHCFALALQYRWDFEGDGVWDTEFSSYSATNHRYTKAGKYAVAVDVKDRDGLSSIARDTVLVFGENLDIDTLCDSRDGNKYRIVKVAGQWWMAENLRYGSIIPTNTEQMDNGLVERYKSTKYQNYDSVGGLYSWLETKNYDVNDPKGICPDGWHLPSRQEWDGLFSSYPVLYSLKLYGNEGLSQLNLDLNNGGIRIDGFFQQRHLDGGYDSETGFWSSSYKGTYLPYFCSFNSNHKNLMCAFWDDGGLSRYYTVRCIRDE